LVVFSRDMKLRGRVIQYCSHEAVDRFETSEVRPFFESGVLEFGELFNEPSSAIFIIGRRTASNLPECGYRFHARDFIESDDRLYDSCEIVARVSS